MATVLNTLYPPSVNSYLPAFPYDENAKILFSLSPFNSISEIEFIHVSVVDQRTNENILIRKEKVRFRNLWGLYVNNSRFRSMYFPLCCSWYVALEHYSRTIVWCSNNWILADVWNYDFGKVDIWQEFNLVFE